MLPKSMTPAILLSLLGLFFAEDASAMYNARVGSFCSRDPIGYEGSPENLYRAYFIPNGLDAEGTHDTVGPDGYPPYPIGRPDDPPIQWPIIVNSWPTPGEQQPRRPSKDAACTCTTINGSIMRPTSPTTGKAPPVAGQRFAECTVGEVVMVKYKSSCKANPDWPCDLNCDGSTCWQYVSYRCEARNMRPTMKRPDIRTRWTGGPFPTVLSACSL